MRVLYAVVCDFALVSADGKPTIVGVFDAIRTASVPFIWPRFAFAGRVEFAAAEAGATHLVQVVIRDPGGRELGRAGGELTLSAAPPGAPFVNVDPQMTFDGFAFHSLGLYTFTLEIDGTAMASTSINIVHQEAVR